MTYGTDSKTLGISRPTFTDTWHWVKLFLRCGPPISGVSCGLFLVRDKKNQQVEASYAVVLVVRLPFPVLSLAEPMWKRKNGDAACEEGMSGRRRVVEGLRTPNWPMSGRRMEQMNTPERMGVHGEDK